MSRLPQRTGRGFLADCFPLEDSERARHVKYGALPAHYPLVGNSLLKTLGQYAGEAWTPELESAWAEAYG
ncbi:MAG: globin domain-containing protein, partial [Cyanobacteria bacterium J06632_22]